MTPQQKEEFRRLTQKANRRIAKAFREYEKEGLKLVPKALTGGFVQSRKEWSSQKYALSRSVTQFKTKKDYSDYMRKLRQFDIPEESGGVPTYTQYQDIGYIKIMRAIETALGNTGMNSLPPEIKKVLEDRIRQMTVIEQSDFWKFYEIKGGKLGLQYASNAAMETVLEELYFKEDIKPVIIDAIVQAQGDLTPEEKKDLRRRLKYNNNQKLIERSKKL